ncbi:hypothetical protein WMF27_43085 [Sorangium sp. So ce281]|uniref:hypothetical protein n=1 Tax=unclassified Sorangium TaxID=2621164 RepID=UPI003F5EAC0F
MSEIFAPSALEMEGTLYELLMQGPNVGDDAGDDVDLEVSAGGMRRENKDGYLYWEKSAREANRQAAKGAKKTGE